MNLITRLYGKIIWRCTFGLHDWFNDLPAARDLFGNRGDVNRRKCMRCMRWQVEDFDYTGEPYWEWLP